MEKPTFSGQKRRPRCLLEPTETGSGYHTCWWSSVHHLDLLFSSYGMLLQEENENIFAHFNVDYKEVGLELGSKVNFSFSFSLKKTGQKRFTDYSLLCV